MIGGYDYIFTVDCFTDGLIQDLSLQFFRATWPAGMVETDSTADPLPISNPSAPGEVLGSNDLYFYSSAEAAQLWTELGAVEANHNTMVYLIIDPSIGQVTAVVSEPTDAMLTLLNKLQAYVKAGYAKARQSVFANPTSV